MKLRSYLYSLALVTVLPLLVLSGVMIVSIFLEHLAAVKEGLVDTSRAISLAVDRKLMASIETLTALASSEVLDTGELDKFRVQADRVLAAQESWSAIAVVEPSGRQVLDLAKPPAQPFSAADSSRYLRDVLAARSPVVSDLIGEQAPSATRVYVAVPVTREKRVRYVLVAAVEPPSIERLLVSGQLPGDRVATIIDRRKAIVASSVDSERLIGKPTTRALALQTSASMDGSLTDANLDGV